MGKSKHVLKIIFYLLKNSSIVRISEILIERQTHCKDELYLFFFLFFLSLVYMHM